jgi:hypothetical protein
MKRHTHLLLPLLVMLAGSGTVGWLTALGLTPLSTQPFAVLGPVPDNEFGRVLGSRISRARLSRQVPIVVAGETLLTLSATNQALIKRAFQGGRTIIVTQATQQIVDELTRVTGMPEPLLLIFNAGEPPARPAVGLNPSWNGVSTYQLHSASTGAELEREVTGLMSWARRGADALNTHGKAASGPLNLALAARHYQEVDQFTTPLGFVENRNTHTVVYSCTEDAYYVFSESDLLGAITGVAPTVLQTFLVDRLNALEIPGVTVEQTLPESTAFAAGYRTGSDLRLNGPVDYFDIDGHVTTTPHTIYLTDHLARSGALKIESHECVAHAFPEVEYTAQSDPERGEFRFALSWVWRVPGSDLVPRIATARLQFLTSDDADTDAFSINTLGMTLRFPERRCARGQDQTGKGKGTTP